MSRKQKKTKSRRKHGQQKVIDHGLSSTHKPVGLFVTKELATAIEHCRKRVEYIAKECRAKNVRFRDREFDLDYDPFRCLHGYTEYIDCSGKDVQRVTEIFDDPHFFPEGGAITSNAIRQGDLGDCYFLSALATVSCIPNLIEKICVARDEAVGVYGFIFYRDSGWTSVIIDDMLFTNIPKFEELDKTSKAIYHEDKEHYNAIARKGGSILLFARAGSQEETWVPLIEKAYAKLYGNFAHLEGGFTNEAVEDLTGGVSTVFITKDIFDVNRFWEDELQHVNEDRVFACGFLSLNAPEDEPGGDAPVVEGLYGNHAYSLLRAVECKGKRFVVIRNPWGRGEWTGRWSDGAKEWTQEWLEILPQLGHTFGDDGQFVMEYKDFLRCFDTIHRTFLFDDSWVVSSDWKRVPLNDHPRAWAYGALSYLVTIPEKTKTIFVLSRLNDRFFRSIKKTTLIGIEYVVVRIGDTEPIATACEYRPFASRSVSLQLDLNAGTYAVYVRFDRELKDGENKIGFADTPDCDCCPPAINTSTRVISRILSSKVESQSIVSNWEAIDKLKPVFIAKSLKQVIADDYENLSTLLGDPEEEKPSSDIDTLAENGDAPKDSKAAQVDGKDDSEAVDESPKGVNGTVSEHVNGDAKASAPGALVETSDHASLPGPNYTWRNLLQLFAIGCLNLVGLFGLTLIGILEVLKPLPGTDKSGEEASADGNQDSHVKEGESKDDAASSSGGDDAATLADGAPLGSLDTGDWRELLKDDGKNIFLGLRVYTQTEEPALVTGRVSCEGPELCICTRT
ncbi:hypothetical protein BKA70DRAFT_1400476 [Coprinopsis sp. MPI-PUGE-AT-0042]|nr:hypothetical protein BKA70DRAFT_1400476 [Coprinopsis sp. MPI-PUGE-AT-0042]